MPSLRSLTSPFQKAVLACAALLLLLLGAASGGRLESGQGLAVQVLRQTIGYRLQQNLRRPVILKARGVLFDGARSGDEETPMDRALVIGLPARKSLATERAVVRVVSVPAFGESSTFVPTRARTDIPEARAPPLRFV